MKGNALSWTMIIVGLLIFAAGTYGVIAGADRYILPMAVGTLLITSGVLVRRREDLKKGGGQ